MNEAQSLENEAPLSVPMGPKKDPSWKSILKEIGIFLIIAVCIVWPFRVFIAEPYIVDGASMDPTFKTGDYLIVDKLSYEIGSPKRNSVIVFKFPSETSRDLIKRVIGLPGDTLTMNGNDLTITNAANPKGFVLPQTYLTHMLPQAFTITLKDDEYFVMGDNRPESYDSRAWGVLPKKDILGRPLLRLFPVSKIGVLPGDYTAK